MICHINVVTLHCEIYCISFMFKEAKFHMCERTHAACRIPPEGFQGNSRMQEIKFPLLVS